MCSFNIVLSKEQERDLVFALDKARRNGNLTVSNRILAVLNFAEWENTTFEDIASFLKVSDESVRQWVKKYILGGIKALTEQKRSPGRPAKLTKKQRKKLYQMIVEGPQKAGFPGACWRTPMIQELIYREFNVLYAVKYISQLLKNMELSYQKARFDVGGKDEENERKRQEWLDNTWPQISSLASLQNAWLLFGDEASFPQWGTLTYTWAPKGQQPTVKTSGNRRAYKVFGLIDYFTGRFFYKTHEGRFNSESYSEFLKEVLSKTRKHIILIQDGARYHTSKAMDKFFEKHKKRLTIFQLPTYSPDYNPIEKLWKELKKEETHLQYFPTFDSLKDKVNEALLNFAAKGRKLLSLFGFYKEMEEA